MINPVLPPESEPDTRDALLGVINPACACVVKAALNNNADIAFLSILYVSSGCKYNELQGNNRAMLGIYNENNLLPQIKSKARSKVLNKLTGMPHPCDYEMNPSIFRVQATFADGQGE